MSVLCMWSFEWGQSFSHYGDAMYKTVLSHNISDLSLDHWGDKIMAECPSGHLAWGGRDPSQVWVVSAFTHITSKCMPGIRTQWLETKFYKIS